MGDSHSGKLRADFPYLKKRKHVPCFYLNNEVFLPRNCWLVVAPQKFDVLKTNICLRSKASRANMLVLGIANFDGPTIIPIVLMSLLLSTKFSSAY